MVDLCFGNLPYIISRCKNCLHSHDLIIRQRTKQDPQAQLSSWVLLNSDTAFVMKKQQFEISPTDSARRKMENVQNSLILKTLMNSLWIYEYTYLAYLSNEIFFFLTCLYFPLVVHIGSERDKSLPHVSRTVRGGNFSFMCIKIRNLYFLSTFYFANKGEIGESIHSILSMTELSL